jgi:hypothetical protein
MSAFAKPGAPIMINTSKQPEAFLNLKFSEASGRLQLQLRK